MPVLFSILIKINFALVLFVLAYYAVLRKLTFYTLNRSFLLSGILISTLYPLLDLADLLFIRERSTGLVPVIKRQVSQLVQSGADVYWKWAAILFWVVTFALLVRLVIRLMSLWQLHRLSWSGIIHRQPVRMLDEEVAPFSFWKQIYINPRLHSEQDITNILAHEQVHVKQMHTLDILLAELSVVFYWFNPAVWLIRRAIRENLEFVTDDRVLRRGIGRKQYQYSLLEVSNITPFAPLTNHFNISDLKKRIRMMNARRSSRFSLGYYLFLSPVLLCVVVVFAVSWKVAEKSLLPKASPVTPVEVVKEKQQEPEVMTVAGKPLPVKQQATPKRNVRRASQPRPEPAVTQPDTAQTIVVVGYPSPKRQRETTDTSTSSSEQAGNDQPVRVVTGYPTPRRTN